MIWSASNHSSYKAMNQLRVNDCPFCRIVGRLEPAVVVDETAHTLAFFPLEPATRGHTMVVSKWHIADFFELDDHQAHAVGVSVLRVARALRAVLEPEGMNIITSAGEAASQSVMHLHVHLVPRWTGDPVGEIWPRKAPTPEPILEDTAECIRKYCHTELLEYRNPE